ncbi:MAG: DUF4214 domain-containing protein [Nostoc sp.]|uniref:DUF4214 domain-containing protein n=1 Tax=Nostoc sp. TaxID=1180 RepID=UPI002FF980D0
MTTADINSITGLYVAYFDRAPDVAGLDGWLGQAKAGVSLETIADAFGNSLEAAAKYPYLDFPNIADPTAFVTSIYFNAFGRAPDATGLAGWVNQLKTEGPGQVSTFILTLIQGAQGPDIIALQNKEALALRFTLGLLNSGNSNISTSPQTVADSASILDTITSTSDSTIAGNLLTAGNAAVDAQIANYTTIALTSYLTTSSTDSLVATANNDTIVGANTGTASEDQVQTGDKINGGAGIDTFQYIGAYGTAAAVPTLLNVEKVELLNPTTGTVIDFTGKTTGLQQVTIEDLSSTLAAFTAKGLSGITFGVEGATLTAGATPTTTVTALTADFGTATSANLSIKDAIVTTADLSTGNAALTTLNIAADGLGENLIGLKLPAATTTLKITGAGTLDLGTTPTTVSTIDASANTGGVDVTVGAVNATFTGGSGNDTFTSALTDFDANDKLDGGTGTTDTLILTGINTALTTPQYAAIKAINGFEVLNLSGTAITVDASQLPTQANDIFTLTQAGDITVTNATGSNTFTLAGSTANKFDLTGTGAANIALQDTAKIDALNLTGATSLNIQSNKKDATTASNSITLGTGTTVPIKVTGDSALTILQPTTPINNVNIDATGFQGALTATGGGTSGNDILIGGNGNDTLTGGGTGTTNRLVGGLGSDLLTGGGTGTTNTFVFSIAGSNAGSFTGGTTDTYDTASTFAEGTDKIELSGGVFNATSLISESAVQTAVGSATTLSTALPNAATAIGAGKFGAFKLGSDTYILGNDATVGTLNQGDLLIKLAGVTTTLAAGDFTFS